jgi:phosphoribosylaminoimidazole-succinocarboxamide synthase
MEPRQELYRGKAKTVYATDDPHHPRHALPRRRVGVRRREACEASAEGETNNKINAYVMGRSPTPAFRRISSDC